METLGRRRDLSSRRRERRYLSAQHMQRVGAPPARSPPGQPVGSWKPPKCCSRVTATKRPAWTRSRPNSECRSVTLYARFPGKAELFEAMAVQVLEHPLEILEAVDLDGKPPREQVIEVANRLLATALKSRLDRP